MVLGRSRDRLESINEQSWELAISLFVDLIALVYSRCRWHVSFQYWCDDLCMKKGESLSYLQRRSRRLKGSVNIFIPEPTLEKRLSLSTHLVLQTINTSATSLTAWISEQVTTNVQSISCPNVDWILPFGPERSRELNKGAFPQALNQKVQTTRQ